MLKVILCIWIRTLNLNEPEISGAKHWLQVPFDTSQLLLLISRCRFLLLVYIEYQTDIFSFIIGSGPILTSMKSFKYTAWKDRKFAKILVLL